MANEARGVKAALGTRPAGGQAGDSRCQVAQASTASQPKQIHQPLIDTPFGQRSSLNTRRCPDTLPPRCEKSIPIGSLCTSFQDGLEEQPTRCDMPASSHSQPMCRFILFAILTGLVGHLPCHSGQSFFTKGSWPAFTGRFSVSVKVVGDLAYVTTADMNSLLILSVTNAATPTYLGQHLLSGSGNCLQGRGQYAYVAAGSAGLEVVDVSEPAHPRRVGVCDTPGSAEGLDVAGQYAYVADGTAGLQVIDVRDPAAPVLTGNLHSAGTTHAVQVAGSYAYVADDTAGLQLIDIATPATPARIGSADAGSAYGVQIHDAIAYVADSSGTLIMLDVRNPANPRQVGLANVPSAVSGVSAVGSTVYASTWYHGLQVLRPRPSLRLASWLPQTSVTLELDGEPSLPITLEAASHLNPSTVWSPVITTNPPALPILITDTSNDSALKFYRVHQQP
jgi:hypothetical protein